MDVNTGVIMRPNNDIYGGRKPTDVPLYTYARGAQIIGMPISTLRSWTIGQHYISAGERQFFQPPIETPDPGDARLSFNNIIEAFVLRALRRIHVVQLRTIRVALDVAQEVHGIRRLLIHPELRTSAGELFLDKVSELEELSLSRQLVLREIFSAYLRRVEWENGHTPLWLKPFPRRPQHKEEEIVGVNPTISFGKPLIRRVGISTEIVALRYDSGENERTIVSDYGLRKEEFDEALFFEGAA